MGLSNTTTRPGCDPIVDRIEQTLKYQNKTKKELLQHLGLRETNFTNWKYRNGKSYMKYIDGIADYLGVTIHYLMYGIEDTGFTVKVSEAERTLLEKYRMMDAKKQHAIDELFEVL